jgi:hypothetical protein
MDFTMLRQMARRCRLLALLHHPDFEDPVMQSLAQILDQNTSRPADVPKEMDAAEVE